MQLFDLLMLAADLQEQELSLEAVDDAEPMAERALRAVAHACPWVEQRAAWKHRPATDASQVVARHTRSSR